MPHAPHELPPTVVDVSALIGQPGASRPVDLVVPVPEGFEVPLTTFAAASEEGAVRIEGVLESLLEGVLLRGTVSAEIAQQCARCLTDLPAATATAEVAELFDDPALLGDPDDAEPGYAIADERIDLDALVRDALADAVPAASLCRADCAGLCPTCGIDRNSATCDCGDDVADPRWAALSDLDIT